MSKNHKFSRGKGTNREDNVKSSFKIRRFDIITGKKYDVKCIL